MTAGCSAARICEKVCAAVQKKRRAATCRAERRWRRELDAMQHRSTLCTKKSALLCKKKKGNDSEGYTLSQMPT